MKKTLKHSNRRTASVSEVKASLSSYLARVKAGEEVVLTERGTPIAKLVPLAAGDDEETERLLRLAAHGVVTPGSGTVAEGFWKLERPSDPGGRALSALLEERASGW
jgi:prevent-host-death family protein